MKFTRRHARALATGAAATAAYLAGAKLSDSRVIRAGSLLALALTATVSAQQASAVAKTTKKRVDQLYSDVSPAVHFINHGGTISGSVTVSGSLTATSGLATSGAAITTSGGNLSMGSGDITCDSITSTGTGTYAHILMSGGNINMGGNNCNTGSAYVISGAPHRANLGTVAFTSAGLQSVADRADFILNTAGTSAGWAS